MVLRAKKSKARRTMGQLVRLTCFLALGVLAACAVGSAAPAPDPAAEVPTFPAIRAGTPSPNEEVAGARLLASARDAFQAGDFQLADSTARALAEQYPRAPGSSEALLLWGRSALALEDSDGVVAASSDLLRVLPREHPEVSGTIVLLGDGFQLGAQHEEAVRAYLQLDEPGSDSLLARVAASAPSIPRDGLERLLEESRDDDLRRGPLLAELSLVHALAGNQDDAQRLAQQADRLGVVGRSADVVGAVLSDDLSAFTSASLVLGAVLPLSGSPTNRTYAERFLEGVQIALQLAETQGMRPRLIVEDNQGTVEGTELAIRSLEDQGVLAVIGPLLDENVTAAASARFDLTAVLSPTGQSGRDEASGVYSLAALDPGAATTLAEALRDLGYDEAALVHSDAPDQSAEAQTFSAAFSESGGRILTSIGYAPGTTYFEEAMLEVEALQPPLLVLAIPESDVEILVPQVSFFGLDTLDIDVAGTAPFTEPQVLNSVANRHTDRMVSVASFPPGAESTLFMEFVDAYEQEFRRTLRSPIPAVGFDLVQMILAAYGSGVRTNGDLVAALERMEHVPGVTGTYGVTGGQIVREYFPVRIFERELLPADSIIPKPERPTPIPSGR